MKFYCIYIYIYILRYFDTVLALCDLLCMFSSLLSSLFLPPPSPSSVSSGDQVVVVVKLEREDEEEVSPHVIAPFFPQVYIYIYVLYTIRREVSINHY